MTGYNVYGPDRVTISADRYEVAYNPTSGVGEIYNFYVAGKNGAPDELVGSAPINLIVQKLPTTNA